VLLRIDGHRRKVKVKKNYIKTSLWCGRHSIGSGYDPMKGRIFGEGYLGSVKCDGCYNYSVIASFSLRNVP
jgi:hypothetical protein